jgi:hypothetical protein
MTIWSAPDTPFIASAQDGPPNLVGTIGVQVINPITQGVVIVRHTTGIVEDPPGSGVYYDSDPPMTAPSDALTYSVQWDTGGMDPAFAIEDLIVTFTAPILTLKPIVAQVRMLPGVFTQADV